MAHDKRFPEVLFIIFYDVSLISLTIAYAVSLYQMVYFNLRVNLYGGQCSVNDFKRRFYRNRRWYALAVVLILLINLALGILEVVFKTPQYSKADSMTKVVQFCIFLVSFILVGYFLIHNLYAYFE